MSGVCERTLHNLIDHIGSTLNDLEGTELYRIALKQGATIEPDKSLNHVRWSEYFLTSVINDAFRLLNLERPDLFMDNVRFKLKPGCITQPLPDDCLKFGGGLQNSTNCNVTIIPTMMTSGQIVSSMKLSGLFCEGDKKSGNGEYGVASFGFNPQNPNEIIVVPPPPPGEDAYVTIDCVGPPPCYDWPEDQDEIVGEGFNAMMDIYEIMVIEFALFRAYGADHESEASKETSNIHWERALTIINEGKSTDYFFYHPDLFLIGPSGEGKADGVLRNQ